MKPIMMLTPLLFLPGCAFVQNILPNGAGAESAVIEPIPAQQSDVAEVLGAGSQTAEALDRASADEKAAAAAPASSVRALGRTIANLGDPVQAGFWLKTPLVDRETQGRVDYNGASAAVTLIPIDGPATAGSQMSLSAMRLLNAPLADLVELQVFAL